MAVSVAVILKLSTPILYDALLHGSGNGWISSVHLSGFIALFNLLGGEMQLFVPLLLAIGLLELAVVLLAQERLSGLWADASARLNRLLGTEANPALERRDANQRPDQRFTLARVADASRLIGGS